MEVGDSPLVGCGGYANRYGAVSATGHGEANLGGGGEFSIEFLLVSGYQIQKLRNHQHTEEHIKNFKNL